MYDTSRQMGFPLMAGSSLPVTWRMPQVEMPLGAEIREAMCVAYGNVDSYDIHALEAVQCMVERRKGARRESNGCRRIAGDSFWKAHEEGVWSPELFKTALCRSETLRCGREGFTGAYPPAGHESTGAQSGGLSLPIQRRIAQHDRADERAGGGFNFAASMRGGRNLSPR